jgi:hypothetical protein
VTVEYPRCLECKHFNSIDNDKLSCKAFPDGIPIDIITGKPHTKPTKQQDNKIVFEPID